MGTQAFDLVFDRAGLICGTTDCLSPIAAIIKHRKPGPLKMFSPDVASHIVLTIRWDARFADILKINAARYDCRIDIPEVSNGTLLGLEATVPRCRWTVLDRYRFERTPLLHYVFVACPAAATPKSEDAISTFLLGYVGRPYQYGIFTQMEGAPGNDPLNRASYCSEIGFEYLMYVGATTDPEWGIAIPPVDIQLHSELERWVRWRCYKPWW